MQPNSECAASEPVRVSVVMPVYKDVRFLDPAVDSVLAQDFTAFEFIIVDDGSGLDGVFEPLAGRDARIRLLRLSVNCGAAAAANAGIALARAPIIVRLDADDICEPGRIRRLVEALDADPSVGLVGSAVTFMHEDGTPFRVQPMPQTHLEIRWTILFHNPFFHPATAFRKPLFDKVGGYRPHETISHDHYLWHDLLPHCQAANLAEPLVRYRVNSAGLTSSQTRNPRARTHAIRVERWAAIGLTFDLHDNDLAGDISALLRRDRKLPRVRRLAAYQIVLTVLSAFLASRPGDGEDGHALAVKLFRVMLRAMPVAPGDYWQIARRAWAISPRACLEAMLLF